MTRDALRKEKRKLLIQKPILDTSDYSRFQQEMAEWDEKLRVLEEQELELVKQEEFAKLERLGHIANLEKRRNNRMQSIDALKEKYKCIGLDRRYNKKNKKRLQWDICVQIVDMQIEIEQFGEEIEALIEKHINGM